MTCEHDGTPHTSQQHTHTPADKQHEAVLTYDANESARLASKLAGNSMQPVGQTSLLPRGHLLKGLGAPKSCFAGAFGTLLRHAACISSTRFKPDKLLAPLI
jgi:hypothetical protein